MEERFLSEDMVTKTTREPFWVQNIKDDLKKRDLRVMTWETVDEGAAVGVVRREDESPFGEDCYGISLYLFCVGEQGKEELDKTMLFDNIHDYSDIYPGLVEFHYCHGKRLAQFTVPEMLEAGKEFIEEIRTLSSGDPKRPT